jgi:hypothetical protein
MNKLTVILLSIIMIAFLIGASPPPKKRPAQTGAYKVSDNHKSSGKKGVGGICFIDTSQY